MKQFLSTLALAAIMSVAATSAALAQQAPKSKSDSDSDKTKTKENGSVAKSKAAADGKVKMKGKAKDGSKLKAKTKPTAAVEKAPAGVLVGGTMMTPDKDIVDNAVNSTDHTTLVSAVRAAGLVETLKGPGPLTVFAPTNAAFDKLPAGTVNTLVLPENKQKLSTILAYHVVSGRLTAADLKDGQALTTVEGETLTVVRKGKILMLRDAKGGTATVTTADVISSNGVTHVIDTILMPTK
jgi:uncharacterized surface protein with fasciclin (FAS1) repeats